MAETCPYCDSPFDDKAIGKMKSRDHIVPRFLGGSNHPLNLTFACRECNLIKGGMSPAMMRGRADEIQGQVEKLRTLADRVEGVMRERGLS